MMIEKADGSNVNLLCRANTRSTYISILLYYYLFINMNSKSTSIKMEDDKKKKSSYIAPLTFCAYGKCLFLNIMIEEEGNPNKNLSLQNKYIKYNAAAFNATTCL
jgi:hypothetical protein